MAHFIYMTASSKDEALAIGRALVAERLAACVNVLDGMASIYWWKGQVEEGSEVVLVAKTTDELVNRLIERVKSLHSYECPCVVSWPIEKGNEEYLNWIADSCE
jgi:periplasmic divalent cation tolerance protein